MPRFPVSFFGLLRVARATAGAPEDGPAKQTTGSSARWNLVSAFRAWSREVQALWGDSIATHANRVARRLVEEPITLR
jgi:hypothetical protein